MASQQEKKEQKPFHFEAEIDKFTKGIPQDSFLHLQKALSYDLEDLFSPVYLISDWVKAGKSNSKIKRCDAVEPK